MGVVLTDIRFNLGEQIVEGIYRHSGVVLKIIGAFPFKLRENLCETSSFTPPGNPFLAPKIPPLLLPLQLCGSSSHNGAQKGLLKSYVGSGGIHVYSSFGSLEETEKRGLLTSLAAPVA